MRTIFINTDTGSQESRNWHDAVQYPDGGEKQRCFRLQSLSLFLVFPFSVWVSDFLYTCLACFHKHLSLLLCSVCLWLAVDFTTGQRDPTGLLGLQPDHNNPTTVRERERRGGKWVRTERQAEQVGLENKERNRERVKGLKSLSDACAGSAWLICEGVWWSCGRKASGCGITACRHPGRLLAPKHIYTRYSAQWFSSGPTLLPDLCTEIAQNKSLTSYHLVLTL